MRTRYAISVTFDSSLFRVGSGGKAADPNAKALTLMVGYRLFPTTRLGDRLMADWS